MVLLSNNLISEFPVGLFQVCTPSVLLGSAGSLLTQPRIHFQLTVLTRIDLSHNQLTGVALPQITSGFASNLSTLDTLLLSNNKIKTIHPHFFEVLVKLTCLDLSNNMLTELPSQISRVSHFTACPLSCIVSGYD